MNNYLVLWSIDIEAANPLEAAQKAKAIQQDPESIANVFVVHDADEGHTEGEIDLDELGQTDGDDR